ncbi:MAG: glycosyltransferase [Patescibacteria group bacterium]
MKILIATGVYPPHAGGPSYYAKSLKDEFEKLGHTVTIRTFGVERKLPTGIRHLFYFFKTFPAYITSDWTLVLDTFSVGLPVACLHTLFGGKAILRTGGDFLWEEYIERTKEKILLSEFYAKERSLTLKEKVVFALTHFTLSQMTHVVFSTNYQKGIWMNPYRLFEMPSVSIIENRFEPAHTAQIPTDKVFVYAAARPLMWKNIDIAKKAFEDVRKRVPEAHLEFLFGLPHEEALRRIKEAYACLLVSLGDISPNHVLRALSYGKPVVLTSENGLKERIGDAALYVDPRNQEEITTAIISMCNSATYGSYVEKVQRLSFAHTYADIAKEFLTLCSR